MKIILASGSPRRRELLQQAGLVFTVMSADIDESVYEAETPQAYIQRMVAQKAQAALATLNAEQPLPTDSEQPFLLLTADTIGILPDGKTILIKPEDNSHALNMWQQMSASTHQVCTAVQATLITATTAQASDTGITFTPIWSQSILESTAVTFVELAAAEMQRYWQTGEPADKAGGYAIQGGAAHWVARIEGSYTNVVGLPLAQTLALIEQACAAI
ncbi:nucleoside triphosphate pyrophosphatase [Psychrobacter arenosus]|uniref:Maf family protein n=1 Tax=Psychrobacter arenosus TaxID=256326 RepID=UPI001917D2AF|nr:Maf family protein [Psychrobacter arenosus]